MRRLTAALLLLTLLAGCLPAAAANGIAETSWMTVLLGGRKIGHIERERQHQDDTITTVQTLSIELNRDDKRFVLENMSRSVERDDGQPLGFAARTRMSADASTVEGHADDQGRFQVTTTVGGSSRLSMMDWPVGALLAEGQREATVAAGRRAGDAYTLREFDPSSQQVVNVKVQILGDETVSLPGGSRLLSHQRQTLRLAHGEQFLELWVDDQGIARKGLMTLLGQPLEMLACDQACALAPNQDVDMLRAAMVLSPRMLPAYLRIHPLRYRVRITGQIGQPFITTDEQQVAPLGDTDWVVDVGTPHPGRQAPPQPSDKAPNAWLQSDAPAIRRLAAKAVQGATDDRTRMHRLRVFVSHYITKHGLDVGYASALEVVRDRQGDCTEYAVLLAAMARAQGIPARVVTGMVYADRFAGANRVFVPHEWVQAWIDDRWRSYDAALEQFDSTHLALAAGDGDPWRFAATTQLFGNLHIRQAVPGPDMSTPVGSSPAPSSNGNQGGNPAGH